MSLHPETQAVRAGIATDPTHGAVSPPLFLSANFAFAGLQQKRAYDYTRSGNPTRDELAHALAGLEGGAGAVVTATGMAAITLVLHLLEPGDLLVLPHDGYGGTWRIVDALARKGHFEVAIVDLNLPDGLGTTLSTEIRSHHPEAAIVLMSGADPGPAVGAIDLVVEKGALPIRSWRWPSA